jgi:hypothetical protein
MAAAEFADDTGRGGREERGAGEGAVVAAGDGEYVECWDRPDVDLVDWDRDGVNPFTRYPPLVPFPPSAFP